MWKTVVERQIGDLIGASKAAGSGGSHAITSVRSLRSPKSYLGAHLDTVRVTRLYYFASIIRDYMHDTVLDLSGIYVSRLWRRCCPMDRSMQ